MITLLDVVIPLGILLAMLLSQQPKKTAIALCGIISVTLTAVDYFTGGWIYYYCAIVIEFAAFLLLMVSGRYFKKFEDRVFFRALSAFFLVSAGITAAFTFEYIAAHKDYVFVSHSVALAHVAFMLGFSDGIRKLARDIRHSLFDRWGSRVSP